MDSWGWMDGWLMIPLPGAPWRGHLSGGRRKVATSGIDNVISRLRQQSQALNIAVIDNYLWNLGLFPFLGLL